ncbi:MAG TPA: universal stress protein [Peptococcaceae bacterium]|nr:MAG: Universal stress protein UspA and related nucleotide-binding protein [Clostridia bacterium 41_269]HBT20910.1 universal stress protein [Peptococcaceae bacterium]
MKVLLCADGSENSIRTAEYAALLAKAASISRITVLHVDNLITLIKSRGVTLPSEFKDLYDPKVKEGLNKIERILQRESIPFETKVLEDNDAAEAICEFAKFYNYDLIIMGSRGIGGIKGLLLGSVSSKVLQLAHCPVTIVK